jgi:hypothetical protein
MTPPAQATDLAALIRQKLARRRHQNFADVVTLIRTHNLDESFLSQLPQSLHAAFIECLEEKRRDDEWEERTDRQVEEMMRQIGIDITTPDSKAPHS